MIQWLISLLICLFCGELYWAPEAFPSYPKEALTQLMSSEDQKVVWVVDQEIDELKAVLKRTSELNKKTELYLRLSELYHEKYRTLFSWENKYHIELVKNGKVKPSVPVDNGYSFQFLRQSLSLAEQVAKKNPNYREIDSVYFFLALNYGEMGRIKTATSWYERLMRERPNSKYKGEALSSIGEQEFRARKFRQAYDTLKKAISDKQMKSYPKSNFYLAWCLFKFKRYDEALKQLEHVIQVDDGNGKYLSFKQEALTNLPDFYAAAGGSVARAPRYFSKLISDRSIVSDLLGQLAAKYEKRGQMSEVVRLQGERLKQATSDVKRLEILIEESDRYARTGQVTAQTKTLLKAVADYGPKSKWSQSSEANDEDGESLRERLKVKIRNAGAEIHKAFQRAKDEDLKTGLLKLAGDLYQAYLDNYPDAGDVQEVRFYKADVLYQKNSYLSTKLAVADTYHEILMHDGGGSKIRKDSAVGQIGVLDEALKKSLKSRTRSKVNEKMVQAIDDYIREFPRDSKSAELLLRSADLLEGNREQEKINRYVNLISQYPESIQAKVAAGNALQILEKNKDWEAAEKLSKDLLEKGIFKDDKKFSKQMQQVSLGAKFKQAEELEKNKQYEESAREFLKLSENNGDSEISFKAMNNASVNFEKAGLIDESEEVSQKLLERFPTSSVAAERWLGIASARFTQGRFSKAVDAYWVLANSYKGSGAKLSNTEKDLILNALKNGFLISEALEDNDKFVLFGETLAKHFSGEESILDLRFKLNRFYFEQKAYDPLKGHLIQVLKTFSKTPYRVEADYWLGRIYAEKNEVKRAINYFRSAVREYGLLSAKEKNLEVANYAAHSLYILYESDFQKFKNLKLQLPPEHLKKDIQEKLSLLETLSKNYISVIAVGSPSWGVNSYLKIAEAYQLLSEDLRTVPVPRELGEEDVKKFKSIYDSEAKRVLVKSYEILHEGFERAQNLEVLTSKVTEIYRQLSELRHQGYEGVFSSEFGSKRSVLVDPELLR